MKIGMNQAQIEEHVAALKAGEDEVALERRSGVEPAWFDLNRAALLRMAGLEVAAEEEGAAAEEKPKGKKAKA